MTDTELLFWFLSDEEKRMLREYIQHYKAKHEKQPIDDTNEQRKEVVQE